VRTICFILKARILSKLESTEEGEQAWRSLIQHNPDNHQYYHGLLKCKNIDLGIFYYSDWGLRQLIDRVQITSQTEILREPYRSFLNSLSNYRKLMRPSDCYSEFPQVSFSYCQGNVTSLTGKYAGDDYKQFVKPYLLYGLKKGIPSLFADIKSLYHEAEKRRVIEELVEDFQKSLQNGGSLDVGYPLSPSPTAIPTTQREAPTTYLWTLYFLAQHYSFLGQNNRSLALISDALEHTPTLPELHTFKGRVLKRLGDPVGAAHCLNAARLLDGQDRFLNTKCAKYKLRAGFIDEANEILGLFTKVRLHIILFSRTFGICFF